MDDCSSFIFEGFALLFPKRWRFFKSRKKLEAIDLALDIDNCEDVSRTTQERASVLRDAADALRKMDPRSHVLTYQSIQIVSLSAFSFDSLVRKFYSLPATFSSNPFASGGNLC